jgi:hypothetical protein
MTKEFRFSLKVSKYVEGTEKGFSLLILARVGASFNQSVFEFFVFIVI